MQAGRSTVMMTGTAAVAGLVRAEPPLALHHPWLPSTCPAPLQQPTRSAACLPASTPPLPALLHSPSLASAPAALLCALHRHRHRHRHRLVQAMIGSTMYTVCALVAIFKWRFFVRHRELFMLGCMLGRTTSRTIMSLGLVNMAEVVQR